MKAIKGFDANLQCRGFQFEIGKTYRHEGEVKACEGGFHAIPEDQHPLSVFRYYPPAGSRFCIVELGGATEREGDKIAAELRTEWHGICEAMNTGTYRGTEAEALAEIERIKAEIAELEKSMTDLIDREAFNARMAANYARINERPRDVIRRHADRWPLIVAGGMIGGAFLMAFTGWM